jgi:hypothetical protein
MNRRRSCFNADPQLGTMVALQEELAARGVVILPLRKDKLYTATVAYDFLSQLLLLFSVADERVGDRDGVYAGIRLQQTLTTCSRCFSKGRAY